MIKYFIRLVDTFRSMFRRKSKADVRPAADNDYEYNRQRANNHTELNRLLDKINRYGKDSLTNSEREFLKNTHEF